MFLHSKHSGLCSIGMCINFASRSRAGAEEFVEFDSTIWTITWFMHFFGSSPLLLISLGNLWTSISRSYGLWTLQLEQETWPAFDYPFDFLQANAQGTQISMPASVYFGWTMFKLLFHETASVIGTSILLPCKTSLWDEDNSSAMMFHFCNAGRTLYAFCSVIVLGCSSDSCGSGIPCSLCPGLLWHRSWPPTDGYTTENIVAWTLKFLATFSSPLSIFLFFR